RSCRASSSSMRPVFTLRIFFGGIAAPLFPETQNPPDPNGPRGSRGESDAQQFPRLGALAVAQGLTLCAVDLALLGVLAVCAGEVRGVLGVRLERSVARALGAQQGGRAVPEVADLLHLVRLAGADLVNAQGLD